MTTSFGDAALLVAVVLRVLGVPTSDIGVIVVGLVGGNMVLAEVGGSVRQLLRRAGGAACAVMVLLGAPLVVALLALAILGASLVPSRGIDLPAPRQVAVLLAVLPVAVALLGLVVGPAWPR